MVGCKLTVTKESTESPFEVGCILTVVYDEPIFASEGLLPVLDYIASFKERNPQMGNVSACRTGHMRSAWTGISGR